MEKDLEGINRGMVEALSRNLAGLKGKQKS
jgi:hypothetical protein